MQNTQRVSFDAGRIHYLGRAHDILTDRGIDPVKNWDLAELLADYMQEIKDCLPGGVAI